ncbi:Cyanovirin-N [Microdochium bolleyi]|uniref:Cyanovirin-N n=1 Tax=Microdochium bolleyi TaxID=196109 RepID=A0A136IK56_9PEZI|nr:Cyanovirin-N [Microdochium bolleyi]
MQIQNLLFATGCIGAAHAQGFMRSCLNVQLVDWNRELRAKCGGGNDNLCTSIYLDYCIANADGNLAGRYKGAFGVSCGGCTLNGSQLECTCFGPEGEPQRRTSINIDDIISNRNGKLECYGIDLDQTPC